MYILKRNNWIIIKVVVLITILIPVVITTYEFIVLGKESVVFLGDYPEIIGIVVFIYYSILLILGLLWIVVQLKSLLNLKNETKMNELLHLQSQVNPHFFFNMLNNIYGMVDKDTEQAKELILKLSDLMRYSIYEGAKQTVTIEEEIEFLKNYISLHKMRYHKTIDIQFITEIEDNIKVMPLLLVILVENAFKHGVENLRENAFVHIHLITDHKNLKFEIVNNFDKDELPNEKGIGIKNLKRRLALVYPKKHTLNFTMDNAIHKAQLELKV